MKTTTQSPRRGVSHTPQTHTSQSHMPQSHTPQTHTSQTHTPQSHTFQSHTFHRRSIRLKGHDYSDDGFYFITICTKGRHCYFGRVVDDKMVLNEKGQIVKNEWLNTANVRQGDVILHEYVVMPNHFHAIVEICRGGVRNSIDNGVCDSKDRGVSHTPQTNTPPSHTPQTHTPQSDTTQIHTTDDGQTSDRGVSHTSLRSPSKTVGAIVRGFKSAVTKQIGFPIWQRNYYERIIRNAHAFVKISNYIRNNPAQWYKDMLKYK